MLPKGPAFRLLARKKCQKGMDGTRRRSNAVYQSQLGWGDDSADGFAANKSDEFIEWNLALDAEQGFKGEAEPRRFPF